MMKRVGAFGKFVLLAGLFLVLVPLSFGTLVSDIWFEVAELSQGRWEYSYDITNINIPAGVREFTIYFTADLYDGLAVETTDPLAATWDEIVWDPIDGVGVDGAYDALTEGLPIAESTTESGFSVSFDWLGAETPGSQFYEIIDPDTFETIDSGWTVPEPGMLLLLGLGAIISRKKRN